jgi:hypothetical protein
MKKRTTTLTSGAWQAYEGAGVITHAVMDGTSLSSNVLTLYDSNNGSSTGRPTIATWTQDTDFGTTVPVACYRDGSVVATMATESANTHLGLEFFNGVYMVKTGDTTHTAAMTLLIKPLIKKTVSINHGATTDTQRLFTGSGVLRAVRTNLTYGAVALGTLDIIFKDSSRSILTATDYATSTIKNWYPVTTTGVDDAGTAVTTAATGSYTNPGVAFLDSLDVTVAQGSASFSSGKIEVLIDV